jgi:quercetin dioxygenase-like cupin family protein
MTPRRIYHFDDTEWHVPVSPGSNPDQAADAGRRGAARKFLAQGDAGFYSQVVRLPAGFEAPEHSHDHAEVFMVLEGSCRFDGEPMSRFDMVVVAADEPYGFVAGPDGLSFLVVRQGAAMFTATGS